MSFFCVSKADRRGWGPRQLFKENSRRRRALRCKAPPGYDGPGALFGVFKRGNKPPVLPGEEMSGAQMNLESYMQAREWDKKIESFHRAYSEISCPFAGCGACNAII